MTVKEYIENKILLFDGAMGTYYADISNDSTGKCELANLENPALIKSIHEQYIAAGARAIKTNTFGANLQNLGANPNLLKDVIVKGYEIALSAAEENTFVFADIGPIPDVKDIDIFKEYKQIVDIFIDCGATNFLFETFPSASYIAGVAAYLKSRVSEAFILVEFAVAPEGFTRLGLTGKKLFNEIIQNNSIDACGFNCVSGPGHLLEFIKTLDFANKPLSVMPNAGYPTVINNRTFFGNSSDYFARKLVEIAENDASIVGGCCGTSPEYIEKAAKALAGKKLSAFAEITVKPHITQRPDFENPFQDKLLLGGKVIAVELDPPLNTNIDSFMENAKHLTAIGVDTITVADCPIARARVDSSMLAVKLKAELGITPIPHLTCRDRNINATKALLLGLNIGKVSNVLVVTGDPVPSAQKDEVKAMFSYNSANLAGYISELNENAFTKAFCISAALNINAVNFEGQLRHAKKKIDSGVFALFTQPALSNMALKNLKLAKQTLDAKIIGGIMPVVSYKNACFMNNEISGIFVSDEICHMYKDKTREESAKLAIDISTDMAEKMSGFVDGYYIITPFNRIDIIATTVENIIKF